MSFVCIVPHPFTPGAIEIYAPATSGVYGISNAQEWIYIGETDDIQGALRQHLQDRRAEVMQKHPTGFVSETCDWVNRPARAARLVQEYKPACNRLPAKRL